MHSFDKEIKDYINHIESVKNTFILVSKIMETSEAFAANQLNTFLKTKCLQEDLKEGKATYSIPSKHSTEYHRYKKITNTFDKANIFLPRSFIVSLISLYDAYLGKLIKTMFYTKPETLNASQKNIPFSQLMEFTSIEEAKEYIIEKEVETVLRDSHSEQFKWLEKKLEITLTKNLLIWPTFIEVTERRNLFVHADGVVSSQYISVCEKHGVVLDKLSEIGSILNVSDDYFIDSYNCLFEIGFKLGQVVWRKLQPNNIKDADENLIDITFDLIVNNEYDLAIRLLEFANDIIKKYSSQDAKLRNIINLGQAYKWKGMNNKLEKLLKEIDWSALAPHYRIAHSVLKEEYTEASKLMKKIDADDIDMNAYKEWPLFKEFRRTEEFKQSYYDIFGEEYIFNEDISDSIQEFLSSEIAVTKEENID
ncbi:hypothetical protein [Brevibacillus reuszeri]|uniref:hypothetical protein n=1 Tax=Brevibacillus reuszeri TaxID=54915 RepID=UPI003D1CB98D